MKERNKLTLTTPNDRDVVMIRVFDAPRALVFEAMSKPEYVRRWLLGPPGWEMAKCDIDHRVGGKFRYEWRHADGRSMGMGGTYQEIVAPERTVHLETMDGYPTESVVTGVLTEQGGKTTLTTTARFASKEVRDAVIKTGMEHGVVASYDRLDDVLGSMRAQRG